MASTQIAHIAIDVPEEAVKTDEEETQRACKTICMSHPAMRRKACEDFVRACKEGDTKAINRRLAAHINKEMVYNGLLAAHEHKRSDVIQIIGGVNAEDKSDQWLRRCQQAFAELIVHKPDIACQLLDECYEVYSDGSVHFDYKFLENVEYLKLMHNKPKLLQHIVVRSLMSWKWTTHLVWFFLFSLCFYLVHLSFLSAFALEVPNPQHSICTGNNSNTTATNTSFACGLSPNRAAFLTCAAVFVTIFSTLYLLLKIPTLYTVLLGMMFAIRSKRIESGVWIQWTFELTVRHILEIVLHILSIVFVLTTFRNECMCPTRGEWQAGTIAVFFAWIELLSYIQQFPPLGFYIEMLWKIVARFLKVLFIALLLLIAFSFAFYMTFYEPDILDTTFQSPTVIFITMISFAIGSPATAILRLSREGTRTDSPSYSGLSYVIWIIFAVVMSVLFLNFLIGLAVGDVEQLQKRAKEKSMLRLIKLWWRTEPIFIQLLPQCHIKCLKKRFLSREVKRGSMYTTLAFLWGDEIQQILSEIKKVNDVKLNEANA